MYLKTDEVTGQWRCDTATR